MCAYKYYLSKAKPHYYLGNIIKLALDNIRLQGNSLLTKVHFF